MNVLIACEESQTVCSAFRKKGHNAFSCDVQDCSGGYPEWHIKADVLKYLNPSFFESDLSYGIGFTTMDKKSHFIKGKWDMIIAHPPCQYLTLSGNRWFNVEKYGIKALERYQLQGYAIDFFMSIAFADCPRIVIENPVGVMSSIYKKPSQIIHPWQFSLSEEENVVKSTCLWIKGLPLLVPMHDVKPNIKYHEFVSKNGRITRQCDWYYKTRCLPHEIRAKIASKTFPGIAFAMAEQWG